MIPVLSACLQGCQAACWLSGFSWARLAVHLSVSPSIGLPLCFTTRSICPSSQWPAWPPVSLLHLLVCLFLNSLIGQASSPSAFQRLRFPLIHLPRGHSCLPLCLPFCQPVLATPSFSPCVEMGSLITKTHLCLPWTRTGWPLEKQSRQASQPRATHPPPQPSSSRVPTPSLHSIAAPYFWLPHPLSQPWSILERFSRRYLGKTRFKLMVKIRFYDSISVLFLDRFSPLALSINCKRLFSAVFMVMQVNV